MAPFNWTSLQNLLAGSRPKSVNWASSPPINNSYEIGFYQPYFIIQYKSNFDPYKRCLLLKIETSLYIELLKLYIDIVFNIFVFIELLMLYIDIVFNIFEFVVLQVANAVDHVNMGTDALTTAKSLQKRSRKCMMIAIILLLVIALIIILSILKPWKKNN